LAEREGFVVAYPGGTGLGRTALTWNAGPGCCGPSTTLVDASEEVWAFFRDR
jgi:poly(3-hydroxybutyrate) depolymerase